MIYLTYTEKTDLLLLLDREIKALQARLEELPVDTGNILIQDLKKSLPVNINRYQDMVEKINSSIK